MLRIIGAVFRLALKRGQCAKNPVDGVERAVAAAKEIRPSEAADGGGEEVNPERILAPEENGRLLEAATAGIWRTLIKTAFVSGARSGELLALRWTDLELPKEGPAKIAIRRSLSWARRKGAWVSYQSCDPSLLAESSNVSDEILDLRVLKSIMPGWHVATHLGCLPAEFYRLEQPIIA